MDSTYATSIYKNHSSNMYACQFLQIHMEKLEFISIIAFTFNGKIRPKKEKKYLWLSDCNIDKILVLKTQSVKGKDR